MFDPWIKRSRDDPLEKDMATRSSILAWEIPRTEEPAGLQSIRSQSWTRLHTHTHTHTIPHFTVIISSKTLPSTVTFLS